MERQCEPTLHAACLASLPKPTVQAFLDSLSGRELVFLAHDWRFWARPSQREPEGSWTTWLILGGRGAGKTRAGAEWVREQVLCGNAGRLALIGESYAEAREVMVEGVAGLRALGPSDERPRYETTRRRLLWPNGAVATLFSASDPEGLRGPQFDAAWSDEAGKWPDAEAAWAMLQFGLRLGEHPRQVVTTTPRAVPLIKKLLADDAVRVTRATTYDNRANLADAFFSTVIKTYEGTRLGRQELDGELLEDDPDALWSRSVIEKTRCGAVPELVRTVVGVDPPATSGAGADECGIVVVGIAADGRFYVLGDRSRGRLKPADWARRVADAYDMFEADRVVAEVNQGGEMVTAVLQQVAPHLPIRQVRATRGKWVRAEPIAALYEQGRVRHAKPFAELEDQLCNFTGTGGKSPDRLDALVWAITDLMRGAGNPTIRRL
ncbi:MAG: ATP-binding protein [Rhodobiaceae bacterium]|nr:MAG: ATP-binding protein [Rhodobiaceae bacterium]